MSASTYRRRTIRALEYHGPAFQRVRPQDPGCPWEEQLCSSEAPVLGEEAAIRTPIPVHGEQESRLWERVEHGDHLHGRLKAVIHHNCHREGHKQREQSDWEHEF